MKPASWLLLATSTIAGPLSGQTTHAPHWTTTGSSQAMSQLGSIDFPNSGKPAAQADFLRGVKLLHNFQYEDAITAFQSAQTIDPGFALAYWGEAMAHNYTLWSEQHYAEARAALAKLGATPEARAAKAGTQRERDYLAAVETLYGEGSKFDRDVAYADRMDRLAATYPEDIEAQAFDALATLGRNHGTRDKEGYEKAGAMLERLFERYPGHPGIVHYLIHSYDDPGHAARGLAAARVYDKLAPDSAHAQHMTSHIFLALGMWPDVERANRQARAAVERVAGKPVPMAACGHGGIWLVYARLQQGLPVGEQLAECRKSAEKMIASSETTIVGYPEGAGASFADMVVREGIETGQWAPPLALPDGKLNYARFTFAYGDVLASRSDPARAAAALARMRGLHGLLAANFGKEFPDDDQTMAWNDLALAQAEAVSLLAAGRQKEGLAALQAAASRESALPPAFGPPALQKPSWELLGDERLIAGDKSGAAEAYRQSLKLQPGRRLSLAGLAKATQ